jgi:hypothetical protein
MWKLAIDDLVANAFACIIPGEDEQGMPKGWLWLREYESHRNKSPGVQEHRKRHHHEHAYPLTLLLVVGCPLILRNAP